MRTISGIKVTDTVLGRDLTQDESDERESVPRRHYRATAGSHRPGKLNKGRNQALRKSPRLPYNNRWLYLFVSNVK